MFTHILIATDGSKLAAKAESTGLALAKQLGARVTAGDGYGALVGNEQGRGNGL